MDEEIEDNPNEVLTPWGYFSKYLGEIFFKLGALRTAQNYFQKNGKELKAAVTPEETKKFFGMHAIIGCIGDHHGYTPDNHNCVYPEISGQESWKNLKKIRGSIEVLLTTKH